MTEPAGPARRDGWLADGGTTWSGSRVPMLSRSAHDPAGVRREDPEWLAAAWQRARVLVVTPSPQLRLPTEESDTGPRLRYRPSDSVPAEALRLFLGEAAGVPYFAVTAPQDLRSDLWNGLREVGADLGDLDAGLATAAVALVQWHERHGRCPICGAPTQVERAGWARRCPVDSSEHFPRVDPAVIMLVHDGADRLVLGRQASWPPGRYSILAGFVEPGESAEAAVAREVAEEVGLTVTDVRYVASQPWPFPSSLMLGYVARVDGADALTVDGVELDDARWFTRAEILAGEGLQVLPPRVSIAHQLITRWLANDPL